MMLVVGTFSMFCTALL